MVTRTTAVCPPESVQVNQDHVLEHDHHQAQRGRSRRDRKSLLAAQARGAPGAPSVEHQFHHGRTQARVGSRRPGCPEQPGRDQEQQTYCPPQLLGRVTATMRFLLVGTNPLGALMAGGLATWLGVRSALWIMIGIAVLSGALLLTRTFRGLRDLPAAPPGAAPPPRRCLSASQRC